MTEQRNNELPPKAGSVEKLVTNKEDIKKVVAGTKTATRRNGRYADVGDTFVLEGKEFKVDHVYEQTLGDLTDESAKQEGFESVEEYKHSILSSHPNMPWLPKMRVWVHEFSPAVK